MEITNRESDVIELLAQGLTNKQIGKELGISNHTVRDHISSMLKKTKTTNRVELAVFRGKMRKTLLCSQLD
ncbi:LuxR C-terminal-related transcriptional regulator [Pseudomonas trivialis]|uniref:response regulator transcription factor n=1 Tax=Pseudomonas trivialis TaxID=200450 RepID=UPI0030CC9A71